MISFYCFSWLECPYVIHLQFLYYLLVHSQLCSHNLQNMVHNNYLVLFFTLCCLIDAGFRLWENAVGESELLSGQKFPNRKWRKPCICTFKRTQQNISQRWSHVRLHGPLHVYLLPALRPIPLNFLIYEGNFIFYFISVLVKITFCFCFHWKTVRDG